MYKAWLKKVLIIFILLLLLLSLFYKFIVIDRVFYNISYVLPEKVTTLVIGASHLQVGFDDGDYEHVHNYSNSGMPYFFTYAKAKKLIENNPQVDKLVVSLSPIHVSPYGDSVLFTDKGLSRENAFNYFPLLDDYSVLGKRRYSVDFVVTYLKYQLGVPFNYMEDLKPFLSSLKRQLHFSDLPFSGSYKPSHQNKTDIKWIREKADFYFGDKIYFSDLSIATLKNIAMFTQAKDIQLYVVNMPVFKKFKDLIPQEYVDEQNRLVAELLSQHQHVRYVDYYDFPLLEQDFFDGDHINISGVEKLSATIKNDVLVSD